MKLRARNVIKGVEIGAVNAEVAVEIVPGLQVTSIITKKACENLRPKTGGQAYIVVKASNVMIGVA